LLEGEITTLNKRVKEMALEMESKEKEISNLAKDVKKR
jgi:hypothetical protein